MMISCERYYKLYRLQIVWILIFPIIPPPAWAFQSSFLPKPLCTHNNTNYTTNSVYAANLKTLFSSLSSTTTHDFFMNLSVGTNPDRANAIAFCRVDIPLDVCRGCVQNAVADLSEACPNVKQGVLYDEKCLFRYSNDSLVGNYVHEPPYFLINAREPTDSLEFEVDVQKLLNDLLQKIEVNGGRRKVAAGNQTTIDSQRLYGMLQCSPDLSIADCKACLIWVADARLTYCIAKIGCIALTPSCNLRYEYYPFYNTTLLQSQELLPGDPVISPDSLPPSPTQQLINTTFSAKKSNKTTPTVIIIVFSITAFLVFAAVCTGLLLRKARKKKQKQEIMEIEGDSSSTVESLQYDFGRIRAATDNFSDANKLGEGGFGVVYKGKLPAGNEIAVKRLSVNSRQGDLEFKNEVLLVARLQHRNLVRLLGFAIHRTEKLLVYEFVQNASLDKIIFDPRKRHSLNWEMRYKIIVGIARGVLYLHEDSRLRIIHRDLKASNILLDKEMNPKISDFGMARLFVPNETHGNTSRIVGTYGYMAPEYVLYGQFSVKSDVYSFGVLVLEIVSGQRKDCFQNGDNLDDLVYCAWRSWVQGIPSKITDPLLTKDEGVVGDMLRCIHIGLLCVQENVGDRPTMASVVLMLSSATLNLPMPLEPALFMASGFDSVTAQVLECSPNWNESGETTHSSKNNNASSSYEGECDIALESKNLP